MAALLNKIWLPYKNSSLILKMTVGFILGLGVAIAFGDQAQVLAPLGDLLLRLLSLIVVPIVMLTLIEAVTGTKTAAMARIATKAFSFYIITTAVAVIISLALGLLISPGAGLHMPSADITPPQAPSFVDQLLTIVPSNLFAALAEGNILALIFVALITGLSINGMLHSKNTTIVHAAEQLNTVIYAGKEVTFRILNGVLQYAPIGVFALVAAKVGTQGGEALIALGKLTVAAYLGYAAQILLIYIPLMLLFRVPIAEFFLNCRDAMATAFTTQSSSGTIPVSMQATRRAHIRDDVAGFVIPVGATVNMDGAVIRLGVSIVLAANIVGQQLTLPDLTSIVLTATLISIGTAGVPGAGLIALTILLQQAGLPLDIVALVAGVDVVLGMGATMLNVTGDLTGAHIISRSEERYALPPS